MAPWMPLDHSGLCICYILVAACSTSDLMIRLLLVVAQSAHGHRESLLQGGMLSMLILILMIAR
jgi:hypothetical protein